MRRLRNSGSSNCGASTSRSRGRWKLRVQRPRRRRHSVMRRSDSSGLRTGSSDIAPASVVGIDLGTTNSAAAFVDTTQKSWGVQTFTIPQLARYLAKSKPAKRRHLSITSQPSAPNCRRKPLRFAPDMQDPDYAVGMMAHDQGTLSPGRLVVSAKSLPGHSRRRSDGRPGCSGTEIASVTWLSPVEAKRRPENISATPGTRGFRLTLWRRKTWSSRCRPRSTKSPAS